MPQLRIVGGQAAASGQFPYQVSIQTSSNGRTGWSHWCGGAILTQRHVVTAAHCVVPKQAYQLSIWAGTTRLNSGGIRYLTQSWTRHPNYVELHTADIAIIRTLQSMLFIRGRVFADWRS